MILKKGFWTVGFGCILLLCSTVQAADKIAVVALREVFSQLPQQKEVARQLEVEFSGRAAQLQEMENTINEKIKKLQRDSSVMKSSDRIVLEKEINDMRQQLFTQAQQFEQQTQQRQLEAHNTLLKQIKQTAQQVAKQRGYDLVLDSSVALYASTSKDITAEVIKAIKK